MLFSISPLLVDLPCSVVSFFFKQGAIRKHVSPNHMHVCSSRSSDAMCNFGWDSASVRDTGTLLLCIHFVCTSFRLPCCRQLASRFSMCLDWFLTGAMEDIVRLGEGSQCVGTQTRTDEDSEFGGDYVQERGPASFSRLATTSSLHAPAESPSARSTS